MLRDIVAIRGGGEVGTAIAHKLRRSGFKVFIIENNNPFSIRRTVSYAQAVFDNEMMVQGIKGIKVENVEGILEVWKNKQIPIIVDSECEVLKEIPVDILVDAIMAKKNLGTHRDMAAITIATGPGFTAGKDVDIVIETKVGHDQGRIIFEGMAEPETSMPGESDGFEYNKVQNSPSDGIVKTFAEIGDQVSKGQKLAEIAGHVIRAQQHGMLRGIVKEGSRVWKDQKVLEIDPEVSEEQCYRLSQRSRDVAGSVLEAIMYLKNEKKINID
ncbi:xanthine dehydrogenase accessory factor [Tindallia magadiensis]|uniref:Xanthine dehydrogenase accessory factor n=1 Tax=Tindallia magadiensis TaxID=69895 RepID=A0A1I3F5E4_9FIRM|nr:selenium-dependent molybdenum cofactor biosynthesis protein YqeB [Tindallia magadiensis]SFI06438.1 xanthine dehydrogenase accessory factor [Tindallia magadiensis]